MINLIAFVLILSLTFVFCVKCLVTFNFVNCLLAILFFILLIFAYLILYVLFICFIALCVNKNKIYKKTSKFYNYVTSDLSKKILDLTNTKVIVKGLEKIPTDTRFLFVSNHKTAFDAICYNYLLKKFDVGFISKPENFKLPIVGNLMHREFYLSIDRENNREALKTILKAIEMAKSGLCSIGLFPEGTRNKTDKPLLDFKSGGFKIAQKANVPIVVAVIKNKKNVSFNPFKRSIIEIEILDIIKPETFETSTTELSDRVYSLILSNLENSKSL